MKLAALYCSRSGAIRNLVEEACSGYARAGGETVAVDVADFDVDRDAEQLAATLTTVDACLFATPTHLGGPAHEFVRFAEWSSSLRPAATLQDCWASGLTCGMALDGGKAGTLNYLLGLALQHGMVWAGLDRAATRAEHEGEPVVQNPEGARLGVAATLVEGRLTAHARATAWTHGHRLHRLGTRPSQRPDQTSVVATCPA